VKRTDLRNNSTGKLEAAQVLAAKKQWSNAYYLAGYSIELALKACFAKQISSDTIPDKNLINKVYSHNIGELVGLAGMRTDLEDRKKNDSLFAANWAICSEWSPDARYRDTSSAETTYLLNAISDNTHGVLPWIKNYW
jgi:HEPN domain-containing protein